jgi:hypothetical protein
VGLWGISEVASGIAMVISFYCTLAVVAVGQEPTSDLILDSSVVRWGWRDYRENQASSLVMANDGRAFWHR